MCRRPHTNNESLNSKIWKICPKTGFAGHKVISIAVNDAVMTFNDGMKSRNQVIEKLQLVLGQYSFHAIDKIDTLRVNTCSKKAEESTKEARKARKRLRLDEETQKNAQEGTTYASGMF